MPRKWVLTDEQIVEACRRESRTIDDLFLIRGVREKLNTRDARAVATVLVRGLDAAPDTWPELDKSPKSERNVDAELDLMEALVRLRAKENDIAMQTLASRTELAASPGATPPMSMCCAAGAAPWWGTSCWSFSPAGSPCPSAPKDSW